MNATPAAQARFGARNRRSTCGRSFAFLAVCIFAATLAGAAPPGGQAAATYKEQFRGVIRTHIASALKCYPPQGADMRYGVIVLRFVIAASGMVQKVERHPSSTRADPAIESCLIREASQWSFPKTPAGREMNVIYPFRFESRSLPD